MLKQGEHSHFILKNMKEMNERRCSEKNLSASFHEDLHTAW